MTTVYTYEFHDVVNDGDFAFGTHQIAQTFTSGYASRNRAHNITAVALLCYRFGSSTGDVTVSIKATSAGKPTGADLCSVVISAANLPSSTAWYTFTFTATAALSASTMYAIVIKYPSGNDTHFIVLREAYADGAYGGGTVVSSADSGSSWTIDSTSDLCFIEYGESNTSLFENHTTYTAWDTDAFRGVYWQAQTFTIGNTGPNDKFSLRSAVVNLYRVGSSSGDVVVGIRTASGDIPTGSDLTSSTITGSSIPTTSNFVEFTFTNTITLQPSAVYAIVMRYTSGDASHYMVSKFSTDSGYSGGKWNTSTNSGSNWTSDSDVDLLFEIWGTSYNLQPTESFSTNDTVTIKKRKITLGDATSLHDNCVTHHKGAGYYMKGWVVYVEGSDYTVVPNIFSITYNDPSIVLTDVPEFEIETDNLTGRNINKYCVGKKCQIYKDSALMFQGIIEPRSFEKSSSGSKMKFGGVHEGYHYLKNRVCDYYRANNNDYAPYVNPWQFGRLTSTSNNELVDGLRPDEIMQCVIGTKFIWQEWFDNHDYIMSDVTTSVSDIQQEFIGVSTLGGGVLDATEWAAQIFTPSSTYMMNKVAIALKKFGTLSAGYVEIYISNVDGIFPTNTGFATAAIDASLVTSSTALYEAILSQPIYVAQDEHYAIVATWPDGNGEQRIEWVTDYTNTYGGEALDRAWGMIATGYKDAWVDCYYDLYFRTYGYPASLPLAVYDGCLRLPQLATSSDVAFNKSGFIKSIPLCNGDPNVDEMGDISSVSIKLVGTLYDGTKTLYERFNTPINTAYSMYGNNWLAQIFTVGNTGASEQHHAVCVKLYLRRYGTPGPFVVSLRNVSDYDPIGTDLTIGSIDGNTIPLEQEWIEIPLSGCTLNADSQYAILCRAPGGDATNYISWLGYSGSTYGGGWYNYSNDGGVTWPGASSPVDLAFEEYGDYNGLLTLGEYSTTYNSECSTYSTSWNTQTFTVGTVGSNTSHYITGVRLRLFRVGTPGMFTVSIKNTSGGLPTGADLTAGSISGNLLTTASAGVWYNILFSNPYKINNSTKYAIVARAPSGNVSNAVKWKIYGSTTYAGGEWLYSTNSGDAWLVPGTSQDLTFQEYGNYFHPILYVCRNAGESTPTWRQTDLTYDGDSIWEGTYIFSDYSAQQNQFGYAISLNSDGNNTTEIDYARFDCNTNSDTSVTAGNISAYNDPNTTDDTIAVDLSGLTRLEALEKVRKLTNTSTAYGDVNWDAYIDNDLKFNFTTVRGEDIDKIFSFQNRNVTLINKKLDGEIKNSIIAIGQGEEPYAVTLVGTEMQDATSIATYGKKTGYFIDKSIPDAPTLYKAAKAYLKYMKDPRETLNINICNDPALNWDVGDRIRVADDDIDVDDYYRVLSRKITKKMDAEEEVDIELGTKSGTLGGFFQNMQNRFNNQEVITQGTGSPTNTLAAGLVFDCTRAAEYTFYVPANAQRILISAATHLFRAYSKAALGTTSGYTSFQTGTGTFTYSAEGDYNKDITINAYSGTPRLIIRTRLQHLSGTYPYSMRTMLTDSWITYDEIATSSGYLLARNATITTQDNVSNKTLRMTVQKAGSTSSIFSYSYTIWKEDGHVHDIDYGIYEYDYYPARVHMRIDSLTSPIIEKFGFIGTTSTSGSVTELDITDDLRDSNGKIVEGQHILYFMSQDFPPNEYGLGIISVSHSVVVNTASNVDLNPLPV